MKFTVLQKINIIIDVKCYICVIVNICQSVCYKLLDTVFRICSSLMTFALCHSPFAKGSVSQISNPMFEETSLIRKTLFVNMH